MDARLMIMYNAAGVECVDVEGCAYIVLLIRLLLSLFSVQPALGLVGFWAVEPADSIRG